MSASIAIASYASRQLRIFSCKKDGRFFGSFVLVVAFCVGFVVARVRDYKVNEIFVKYIDCLGSCTGIIPQTGFECTGCGGLKG